MAWLTAAMLLSGCATAQELVSQKEDQLAAAGFMMKPANTAERQDMLKRLPTQHFIRDVHGDTVNYVYADPLVCDCLYVGTQQAYSRYLQYLQAKRLADQQQATAMLYSDPAWNWGMWGPWGPSYPFFGPGW
ncbi:MAG: hypothetical protein ACREFW_06685 [Rhizomicrobium sp.]